MLDPVIRTVYYIGVSSIGKMFSNIHAAKWSLILQFNAVETTVTNTGDLKGYCTLWYHPTRIANNYINSD